MQVKVAPGHSIYWQASQFGAGAILTDLPVDRLTPWLDKGYVVPVITELKDDADLIGEAEILAKTKPKKTPSS